MEREHGRRRNRSAEKHGVMTNVGGSREGTQSSCPLRPPTQGPGRQMSAGATKEPLEKYYSAIKINEILLFAATWMDLEGIMLSEIS